jgi:hypothetical protein
MRLMLAVEEDRCVANASDFYADELGRRKSSILRSHKIKAFNSSGLAPVGSRPGRRTWRLSTGRTRRALT